MIQELNVFTNAGTELNGVIFKARHAKTVMIAITGVHGNFYSNPFYVNIGKTLMNAGIDFIYAQTRDAFNQIEAVNQKTGKKELVGSWSEDFADADGDIQAYLDYATQQHYEHIILAGHSLGANKVIHYLAKHPNNQIDQFVLLSPANIKRLTDTISAEERKIITDWVANDQGDSVLPFQLFGWLPCTANTAHQWLYSKTLDNVHSTTNGNFSQVEKITNRGALIIGTLDSFTYGDPSKYLKLINSHFKQANNNQLIFIQNTGHTYQQKEQELADNLLSLIKQWELGGENNAVHHG